MCVCLCAAVDECEEGLANCDPIAECIDLPVGFECICPPGYTGNGTFCEGRPGDPFHQFFMRPRLILPLLVPSFLQILMSVISVWITVQPMPCASTPLVGLSASACQASQEMASSVTVQLTEAKVSHIPIPHSGSRYR